MSWLLCLRKLVDGVRMEAGRKKEELRAKCRTDLAVLFEEWSAECAADSSDD